MKKLSVALVTLATALIIAPSAFADTIGFNSVGATGSKSASISLSLNVNASGVVQSVNYGSITFNPGTASPTTETITGLLTGPTILFNSSSSDFGNNGTYDQMLSTTFPFLDSLGLAFTLSNGDELQIWVYPLPGNDGNNPVYLRMADETSSNGGNVDTYSDPIGEIVLSPEPGSLVLFGTGLLGLAGMLRFKFTKKSR
jgi:hypothetical protein